MDKFEIKNFMDIPRYDDSARDSLEVYSSPEVETTGSVVVGNRAYEYVMWGADNQLPYQIIEKVEKNSVMSQNKLFNVLTCYGRGIEYMDLETRRLEKPLPSMDADVRKFFVRNSLKRFFAEQITDLKYHFFCVSAVILSRDRTKILRVVHKEACNVRFEKPDEYGRIHNILYANWKGIGSGDMRQDEVEAIPLLDMTDPLGDLLARTGREEDRLRLFKKSPQSETKFAIVCTFPTPGSRVYPVPYWTSTLRDGYYKIYEALTSAKLAKIRNGQKIRYHVEINSDLWVNMAKSQGIALNSEEFDKMKDAFTEKLRNSLGGAANSDKLIWSEFDSLMDGKERHYLKIDVVDTSKAGNEYNDDVAEAANVLCYADNTHPNLAGASPGKSQMNNSGSDKRELFTMKQALETLPHDLMLVVHNCFIYFNGWQDKVYPEIPMIMLTTLDEHTDAKEIETVDTGKGGEA